MPRVLIATENAGKLVEIRAILAAEGAELCSLEGFAPVAFPPEGEDYAANAAAKALAVATQLGEIAIADDSGLEVDALAGAPGPLSARYGGPGLDDAGRLRLLLSELAAVDEPARGARFVCEAALATPDGRVVGARGLCEGSIATQPRGAGGFGYDPIFVVAGGDRVMAELSADEKNAVSHRALAFRALWRQAAASGVAGGSAEPRR